MIEENKIAYGPVPSRRLGQSIGINNIPPVICTYSCVYCQLGHLKNIQIQREEYYNPETIFKSVEKRIEQAKGKNDKIDYLTFVPDGEPTLDINLGREIGLVKELGIAVAVITNSSLIWMKEVRADLLKSDLVSIKIDTVSKNVWKKINRPHKSLDLNLILEGIIDFSNSFKGELITETMLINDINDKQEELQKIADFIKDIKPKKSYLSIPTRPPADRTIKAASEENLNKAYNIFTENSIPTEYLIGYEGNAFSSTGDFVEDVLSITSVHPIREEGIFELLKKTGETRKKLDDLIKQDLIIETTYKNKKFYLRKFKKDKLK